MLKMFFALIFTYSLSVFSQNQFIEYNRNVFNIDYLIDGKKVEPATVYKLVRYDMEAKKILDRSGRLKLLVFGLLLSGAVIDLWQVSSDLKGNKMNLPLFSLGISLGLSGIGVAYWSDNVEIDAVRKYNQRK
jgi:hypothetical protein